MFCILKYIEYSDFVIGDTESLISLKFHENKCPSIEKLGNKELLFNPNCMLKVIIDYIEDVTRIDSRSDYDVSTKTGILLNIKHNKSTVNGFNIFSERETYYIVFLKRNNTGEILNIVPLLDRSSSEFFHFLNVMRKQRGSSSRFSMKKRQDSSKSSNLSFIEESRKSKGKIRTSSAQIY